MTPHFLNNTFIYDTFLCTPKGKAPVKSLFSRSLSVFRECVNSRSFGSLEQHPFFFRKPVVTVGLFNGFTNSQAKMVYILFIINVLQYNS